MMKWREEAYVHKAATFRSIEARRRKHFAYAKVESRRMLMNLYKPAIDIVKSATSTDEMLARIETVNLNQKAAREGIENIYVKVGSDFAEWTVDNLKGEKKKSDDYYDDFMRRYVETFAGEKVVSITETTRKRAISIVKKTVDEGIAAGLSIDNIAKNISSKIGNDIGYRAIRIARTETISASNAGSLQGAQSSGLALKKVWFATKSGNTRQSHKEMDGKSVDMQDTFNVPRYNSKGEFLGVEKMKHPGDPNGSPENVINCRCTVVYERA